MAMCMASSTHGTRVTLPFHRSRRGFPVSLEPGRQVEMANDSSYGLTALVFTRDLARAHRVAAALRAGKVWVNCFSVRDLRAPFGGLGFSGVGRDGGLFSCDFFTEPKAVTMELGGAR